MQRFPLPIRIILFVLFSALVLFVLRFAIGGNEDTWICEEGQWIKHGNPISPPPADQECGNSETSGNNDYEIFQTEDFEARYPLWKSVEEKNILDQEATALALTNDKCNFVLSTSTLPSDQNFSDFMNNLYDQNKEKYSFFEKEVSEKQAASNSVLATEGISFRTSTYSYLTSNNSIYNLAFVGIEGFFEKECIPYIEGVIASISVK